MTVRIAVSLVLTMMLLLVYIWSGVTMEDMELTVNPWSSLWFTYLGLALASIWYYT